MMDLSGCAPTRRVAVERRGPSFQNPTGARSRRHAPLPALGEGKSSCTICSTTQFGFGIATTCPPALLILLPFVLVMYACLRY